MPKTPRQIFSAFKDEKLLEYIAEARNMEVGEKSKNKLITELSEHVSSLGLFVLLNYIKQDHLKLLSQYCHWGKRDKTPTNKATLAKKIHDAMEEGSPTRFLQNVQPKHLLEILKFLETEIPDAKDKDKMAETFLSLADEMGLEKFFSSFPVSKLKEFIKTCGLKIDSESLDTLLTSLIEQESIKAPFKNKNNEIPSKNQPKIDSNISMVDLHTHYFREELAEWCKHNELNSNGSKKELVDRIRRKFDDTMLPRDEKKPPKPPKQTKPQPKRKRQEKSSESEEEKEEKGGSGKQKPKKSDHKSSESE